MQNFHARLVYRLKYAGVTIMMTANSMSVTQKKKKSRPKLVLVPLSPSNQIRLSFSIKRSTWLLSVYSTLFSSFKCKFESLMKK